MKLSIIIPVFNEINYIEEFTSNLLNTFINENVEYIFINDGSNDGSEKWLESYIKTQPEENNKFVNLTKNTGKGNAIHEGIKICKGDYILFQDADMEYDPSEYEKLLEPVIKFDADIVIGSRLMASSLTRRGGYAKNRIGNNFITSLFNLLNKTTFTDIYSGYLIFRRSNITPSKLRADGWDQQAEILSKIIKNSSKIYDVPIVYNGRTYDEGKKIKPKHILGIIGMIIREKILPTEN